MKRRHNSKTLKAPSKYLGNAKEIYTPFTREGFQFLNARIFYQCNPFKWTDRANSVIVLLPQVSTNFCQYRSALKWLFLSMARNYNQQQNELGHFAHYSARPKHFGSRGPTVRLGYVTEVNWPRELVKRRKGTRQGASFSSYGNTLTVRKFGSLQASRSKFLVNRVKILNSFERTKCPFQFFCRWKIHPVPCERLCNVAKETRFMARKTLGNKAAEHHG